MAIYHALKKGSKTQGNVVGTGVSPHAHGAATGHSRTPIFGQTVLAQGTSATGQAGVQETQYANPRATTPVPPTFGLPGSAPMGTFWSGVTFTASALPGQPAFLKNQSDIIGLSLDVTETVTTTSSGTSAVLFASVFDHFVIQSPDGLTIMNVPGGAMLELLGMWGNYPPGNLINNTLWAAVATAQTAAIYIPTSLPQQQNSYVAIPTFNTIVGGGSATATALTASVNLNIEYGDASKGTLNALSQSYTIAAGTYTDLAPTSIAKNKSIAAMLITGATFSAIDELYIESNNSPVDALSAGSAGDILVNRMARQFAGAVPTGDAIYIPKSQFAMNDSSFFRVHNTTTAQTWTVEWLWYT
jgi:hypothetical protein